MSSSSKDWCVGKDCFSTDVKLVIGFNRNWTHAGNLITEQLFCQTCTEQYSTDTCASCSETYKYTDMTYKRGGGFGDGYAYNRFFCQECVDYINKYSEV